MLVIILLLRLIDSALITLDGFSTLNITNSSFIDSNAQSIVFIGLVPSPALRSHFKFVDVTFQGNTGIYALNGNGIQGTLERCSFLHNSFSSIYVINSDINVINCQFQDNYSSYSQLIIYVDNDGISLSVLYHINIINSTFIE